MGELIYMFASSAARNANGVTCLDGMRLLAKVMHGHGIPITWIVSPESARIAAAEITRWHQEFGDEAAVSPPDFSGTPDEKKASMASARNAIKKVLPWAKLTVAGGGHTDPDMPGILEDLGFEALWGFCWEQIEVDRITDRGCPWGFYFMDRNNRLRPAEGKGIIGMEWTARDLLKSFHSGNPTLYSTDPNDLGRGGLCDWDDIGYLKAMADNYLWNTRYNDHVFFLQHQEAHEMERSDLCQCYTEDDIREAAVFLDRFAGYIKDKARIMTLPQAASFYRERYKRTPASHMLWNDIPIEHCNRDYAWSLALGPWPRTFLYYDTGAQMMFVDGKVEPVCIRNYGREFKSGEYFAEPLIPSARLIRNTQFTWSRELEIRVLSPGPMPYGMALWGDYTLYQIREAPGLVQGRILQRDLMFLRYDLKEGENRFLIRLDGK